MLIINEIKEFVYNNRNLISQIHLTQGNDKETHCILQCDVLLYLFMYFCMYFVRNLQPFSLKGVIVWCLVLVALIGLYQIARGHNK
jgi:hypothetical protein